MSRCAVDDCGRAATRRGWCSKHYKRWKATGDPTAVKEPAQWARRNVMPSGYVRVWCPWHPAAGKDGYALEHRKAWHDARGPIPANHHVHHVNGDKADNRIENLELLSESEHHQQHVQEAGLVTNQYGTWPLVTDEARARARRAHPAGVGRVVNGPELVARTRAAQLVHIATYARNPDGDVA